MDTSDISLCLTIGKRPKALEATLTSLFAHVQFEHILAINDFGDLKTSRVFLDMCPHGHLLPYHNLGHHRAIDALYGAVKTPYIFHCEDDWRFDAPVLLDHARNLLEAKAWVSSVCVRALDDFLSEADTHKITPLDSPYQDYARLDGIHDQWYGYSFNPHLTRRTLWQTHGPFARFKKERHLSRYLRQAGFAMAYAQQGSCWHIGFDSVANAPKPWWRIW